MPTYLRVDVAPGRTFYLGGWEDLDSEARALHWAARLQLHPHLVTARIAPERTTTPVADAISIADFLADVSFHLRAPTSAPSLPEGTIDPSDYQNLPRSAASSPSPPPTPPQPPQPPPPTQTRGTRARRTP